MGRSNFYPHANTYQDADYRCRGNSFGAVARADFRIHGHSSTALSQVNKMRIKKQDKIDRVIEILELFELERIKHMQADLDRLTASVANLNTKVDQLLAQAPPPPPVDDGPALNALADVVDAEAAKVDAALPKP